jgi:Fe-S oxidoreductase
VAQLFPQDENARRLSIQTFTLAEFLKKYAPNYSPLKLARKALIHGHCHHKAIMKMDADRELFEKLGLDYELLDAGCCGMAGAFGFEKDHYDVSMACGERVLLPAVRNASPNALLIADGFSCREQIQQATGRTALHTAEVLQMAMKTQHSGAAR